MAALMIQVFRYKSFNRETGLYSISDLRATLEAIERVLGIPITGSSSLIDSSLVDEKGFELRAGRHE